MAHICQRHTVIRPAPGMKGPKIVSLESVDVQYKRVYYAFEASDIECDIGEERGGRS